MSFPITGRLRRGLLAGAAAGLGCLALGGFAGLAQAQVNPYCQYPYYNAYYCRYYPYGYNSYSYDQYYSPEQYYYPEEYSFGYYGSPYGYEPYEEYSYAPYYGYDYGGRRHYRYYGHRFGERRVTSRQNFVATLRSRAAAAHSGGGSAARQNFVSALRARAAASHHH